MDGLVRVKDRRNDALQLEYRFTRDKIKGINFLARAKTIDQFYVYGAIWYNLFDRARVENIYGVEYQSQCWMAGVVVEDRAASPDGTQKREVVFQVYLNVLGVGAFGHKPRFTNL